MFVRWIHKPVTGFGGNWKFSQHHPGLVSHSASLLRSYRDSGKVRQERVASLGSFRTQDGHVAQRDAVEFWSHALNVLEGLELTAWDRNKVEDSLASVIVKHSGSSDVTDGQSPTWSNR